MPEITRRRTGELLRGLFEILTSQAEGMPPKEALAALERSVKLTAYERAAYPTGGPRFDKIVRFATLAASKAGWFLKSKGRWALTDEGRKVYARITDPEEFYRDAVRLYGQWSKTRPSDKAAEVEAVDLPEAALADRGAALTFEEADERAWAEIEQYFRSMNPYEFQDLVAALLKAMGYHVSPPAPRGKKDGGIDILAWRDALGTPPRLKVQVKLRPDERVTVEGLRSFMAVLGADDVGIFVAAGGFTKDAEESARTQEQRKVTLVDLERLFDLWVEYYAKLDEAARRRLPLRPIHFLAPTEG